jgi:hypothetical protein
MRYIATTLCALVLVPLAFTAAHSDITAEQKVGDYSVYMSFFGDAAFAGEEMEFSVFLFSNVLNESVDFDTASVEISKKDGATLYAGALQPPVESSPAYLSYTFPEPGDYVLAFTVLKGTEPLRVTFPLDVYSLQIYDSAPQQEADNRLMRAGSIVGVLLLVVVILYVATRKTS